jgi:mono/diheme cytochrome c family protein
VLPSGKSLMTRTISAAILFLLSILPYPEAIADSADQDIPPPERAAGVDLRDPVVIDKGMEILSSTCGGYCHGTEGRGFKCPSLRDRTDLSTDAMHATIVFGRKRGGKLMPAWRGALSEESIWTVIAAIVSLRHVEGDAVPENPPGGH